MTEEQNNTNETLTEELKTRNETPQPRQPRMAMGRPTS